MAISGESGMLGKLANGPAASFIKVFLFLLPAGRPGFLQTDVAGYSLVSRAAALGMEVPGQAHGRGRHQVVPTAAANVPRHVYSA